MSACSQCCGERRRLAPPRGLRELRALALGRRRLSSLRRPPCLALGAGSHRAAAAHRWQPLLPAFSVQDLAMRCRSSSCIAVRLFGWRAQRCARSRAQGSSRPGRAAARARMAQLASVARRSAVQRRSVSLVAMRSRLTPGSPWLAPSQISSQSAGRGEAGAGGFHACICLRRNSVPEACVMPSHAASSLRAHGAREHGQGWRRRRSAMCTATMPPALTSLGIVQALQCCPLAPSAPRTVRSGVEDAAQPALPYPPFCLHLPPHVLLRRRDRTW